MKIEDIFLRALEPSDIKILMQLENDESYWKYFQKNYLLVS